MSNTTWLLVYSINHAKLLVVMSVKYMVVILAVRLVMWITTMPEILTSEKVWIFIKCNFLVFLFCFWGKGAKITITNLKWLREELKNLGSLGENGRKRKGSW